LSEDLSDNKPSIKQIKIESNPEDEKQENNIIKSPD
jgi:hypothetical protein